MITADHIQTYEKDGVLLVRQALHPEWLMLIEMALNRALADPVVAKFKHFDGQPGEFQETVRNFDFSLEIRRFLFDSPLADMMGTLMGSSNVWYYSDEFFIKSEGGCAPTPWHQDTPYFPVAGEQICSAWISLDPLPASDCLAFVVGSHRGPMYDGFDPMNPGDRSIGYYGQDLPLVPDIDANRSDYEIAAWDITPGDVIFSSTSTLHGGGPTHNDGRRRALAVRCYGDDITYATRPPSKPTAPFTPGLSQHLNPGDALRSPWYPQLRPVPATERYA